MDRQQLRARLANVGPRGLIGSERTFNDQLISDVLTAASEFNRLRRARGQNERYYLTLMYLCNRCRQDCDRARRGHCAGYNSKAVYDSYYCLNCSCRRTMHRKYTIAYANEY